MANERTILVYENWVGKVPSQIGTLFVECSRGKENISFEYSDSWLKHGMPYQLDPNLTFYRGRQYTPGKMPLMGVFSDSAPDRWGRTLMSRRERLLAKEEGRKPRTLTEIDYLLGVYDASRMGALRFKIEPDGPFLSDDLALSTPPWTTLRTLENASRQFEKEENMLESKWLNQLLAPGSSLGGARPKATVKDIDGSLWIAKFPSRHDEYDMGAWEMVAHELATMVGVRTMPARLEKYSTLGSTYLVKRFDRDGDRRIHFASAMTMLGKTDGASAADGTSYLDIADFLTANGASPREDLHELWKRIVFSIVISNTDDHLRNHGFLLTESGWRLSPAYDLNPNPFGNELALNIDQSDNGLSLDLAIDTSKYFGIERDVAAKEAQLILITVADNWIRVASHLGIGRVTIEYMRPAFMSSCP